MQPGTQSDRHIAGTMHEWEFQIGRRMSWKELGVWLRLRDQNIERWNPALAIQAFNVVRKRTEEIGRTKYGDKDLYAGVKL